MTKILLTMNIFLFMMTTLMIMVMLMMSRVVLEKPTPLCKVILCCLPSDSWCWSFLETMFIYYMYMLYNVIFCHLVVILKLVTQMVYLENLLQISWFNVCMQWGEYLAQYLFWYWTRRHFIIYSLEHDQYIDGADLWIDSNLYAVRSVSFEIQVIRPLHSAQQWIGTKKQCWQQKMDSATDLESQAPFGGFIDVNISGD